MFEERLIETVGRLVQFPRLGRAVPEIEDEAIREVIYRGHRIVYILDSEEKCRRTNNLPFITAVWTALDPQVGADPMERTSSEVGGVPDRSRSPKNSTRRSTASDR